MENLYMLVLEREELQLQVLIKRDFIERDFYGEEEYYNKSF